MIHLMWASLAIPVVIHLVYRRRAKRLPFSTLHFLRMIDQRVARRHRLKELLLLALRILLLAAVLGALETRLNPPGIFKGRQVPTSAAILLDNTYSMRASLGGSSAFQSARHATVGILDELKDEDAACLIPFETTDEVAPTPTTDVAGLRERLDAMECGYGSARVDDPLQRAVQSLQKSTTPVRELYIITDMQRLSWSGGLPDLEGRLPERTHVFLVDVGAPVEENMAVSQAGFPMDVGIVGAPSTLYCRIVNHGTVGASRKCSFYLGEDRLHQQEISAESRARTSAIFTHTFAESGTFYGRVQIEPDQIDADDSYYFTVPVRRKVPVLVVNGKPSTIPYKDEVFYLKLALEAGAEEDQAPIEVRVVRTGEFLQQHLDNYSCVVLANVPVVGERWASRLRNYVRKGGGLIVFLGSQVDPAAYNLALGSEENDGQSLLPARIQEVKDASGEEAEPFRVNSVDRQHPVFRNLFENIDLGTTGVTKFFGTTDAAPGQDARTVMDLAAGPLLVEKQFEAGTVMLCTSTCNLEWNNMAVKPYWLPLVHQMVYYAGRAAGRRVTCRVGLPYRFTIEGTEEPVQVEFYGPGTDPAGEPDHTATSRVEGGSNMAVFRGTDRPGIYRARYEVDGTQHERVFAVNVEPAEGDPQRLAVEEAVEMLKAKNVHVVKDPERIAELVKIQRQGLPVWDYLLMATVAIALCESFVANVWLKH